MSPRATNPAGVAALVAFYVVILTAGGQCGCGSSSPPSKPHPTPAQADLTATPWCASVLFTTGGVARACFETEALCEKAAEEGRQIAVLYRIRYIGSCRRRP